MIECLDLKLLRRLITRPAEEEEEDEVEDEEEDGGRLRVPGPSIEFNFDTERREDDDREREREREDDRLPGIPGFEPLVAREYSVIGVRLPGHGFPVEPEEIAGPAWEAVVDRALEELRARHPGDRVAICGLSAGALLALYARLLGRVPALTKLIMGGG